ncbi:MAG: hypothetical protein ABJC66_05595 [Gammaproteobacteria bacterium]
MSAAAQRSNRVRVFRDLAKFDRQRLKFGCDLGVHFLRWHGDGFHDEAASVTKWEALSTGPLNRSFRGSD